MAGVSTQQAKLLAEGFLDGLGSNDYGDFQPEASVNALIDVAAVLIQNAQRILNSKNKVSSGALSDSIQVQAPQYSNGTITLNIEALYYYQFINKGVKGTRGGAGKYSFKNEMPSRKMVNAISGWIKRGGLSTSSVTRSVSNLESKNKSIAQFNRAYAVARSIKQKGIRPTRFFDEAVRIAQKYAADVLGAALKVDIINSLPKEIGKA